MAETLTLLNHRRTRTRRICLNQYKCHRGKLHRHGSAVGFAELGHKMNLLEFPKAKLNAMGKDEMPIMEPSLEEL